MESLPRFLDLLIILNDNITYTKIYKLLPRSSDYLSRGLKYLKEKRLINIIENPADARSISIQLTNKGKDAQRMLITLYNIIGGKEK